MGGQDLLQGLLSFGLHDLVTAVMLLLDPPSLHSAKQVCRAWAAFIQCEVWGRPTVSRRVRARHLDRWMAGRCRERQWRVGVPEGAAIHSLACDHYTVLVGLTDGTARLFQLATGHLLASLDCRPEGGPSAVRGSLGHGVLAAATSTGWLLVWDRDGLRQLFRRRLVKGKLPSVQILPDQLLVTAEDFILLLSRDCQELAKLRHFGSGAFFDAVCDGERVVAATARHLLVFCLATRACTRAIPSGYTSCLGPLALNYPHCFALGATGQVGVWDLESGKVVSSFGHPNRRYWQLSSNGRFCALSETGLHLPGEPWPPLTVTLLAIEDLIKDRSSPRWERVLHLPYYPDSAPEYCCSAINTTSLLAAQGDLLHTWDFCT